MNADNVDCPNSRSLEIIFKEHLNNTIECGQALNNIIR